ERMKMELIAALLHRPQQLLLDEPTIGLDVVAQVKIQDCLKEYHARRGLTMLLTSHYMRAVEAPGQRVPGSAQGRLTSDGPRAAPTPGPRSRGPATGPPPRARAGRGRAEVLQDLPRHLGRADDLPRRLPAVDLPAVHPDADDDPALAGDLRRRGADFAVGVPV